MEALDVKEDGDAEAGVVANPFLDGVGVFGHGTGVAAFAGAGDLADAASPGRKVPFSSTKNVFWTLRKAEFSQALPIWATFSSRVMRERRSAMRCSDGELGVAVRKRALRGGESGERQSERERKERSGDEQAGSKGEWHAAS
jgi:hypothetical protein